MQRLHPRVRCGPRRSSPSRSRSRGLWLSLGSRWCWSLRRELRDALVGVLELLPDVHVRSWKHAERDLGRPRERSVLRTRFCSRGIDARAEQSRDDIASVPVLVLCCRLACSKRVRTEDLDDVDFVSEFEGNLFTTRLGCQFRRRALPLRRLHRIAGTLFRARRKSRPGEGVTGDRQVDRPPLNSAPDETRSDLRRRKRLTWWPCTSSPSSPDSPLPPDRSCCTAPSDRRYETGANDALANPNPIPHGDHRPFVTLTTTIPCRSCC